MENQEQKSKKKFYKRWWFWAIVVFFIIIIATTGNDKNEPQNINTEQNKKVEVVFDIPALINKNIDQIIAILGEPAIDTEPTAQQLTLGVTEWDKNWIKDDYELLVTYNPVTRKVIDFFIPSQGGSTADMDILLQAGNLSKGATDYSVKYVPAIKYPNTFTGVMATPK